MILIVGGTGALGTAAAVRLLAQGESVRVMTRTPAQAKVLQTLGAEIVQGDLRDKDSLVYACLGADAVVASAHAILGRGSQSSKYVDDQGHQWLIDAAKTAGVKQFIYISVSGCAPDSPVPFFRIKYEIEQYLQASGLNYVILRPTAFMETHAYLFIGQPILEKGKVTLFGKGENPRNFVAADDVARFIIIALKDERALGQTIEIGGPQNLTNMQVVHLYEELARRKANVSYIPLVMLRIMAPVIRPFHPGLSQVMKFSILNDTTDQTFDMQEILQQYPMRLTKLEDWARKHLPHGEIPSVEMA